MCFAQMRGGSHGGFGHGGFGHGFGGHGGGFRGPGFHSGFRNPGFFGFRGGYIGPFSYPYLFDSFWDWDNSFYPSSAPYSYSPQPNVVVIYPPPAAPAPPVVIQQTLPPATVQYASPPDDPSPDRPVFTLAFKDRSVSQAAAYWVVGKTLHYVTTEGKRYAVPLAQVDRPLSLKLNREKGVAFGLPG
jgi:hypothetical protein